METSTAINPAIREELLRIFPPSDDPEVQERRRHTAKILLDTDPGFKEQVLSEGVEKGIEKGRPTEARSNLRRVLDARKLTLAPADDAKIDACDDVTTLERWLIQAATATSAAEALR